MALALRSDGAPPQLEFVPESTHCAHCGRTLSPYKSQSRVLVTLAAGTFVAHAFRTRCGACRECPASASRQLAALAPPGQRFGYDLLVWVGLARYHRRLQRSEIQAALAVRGIALSSGSISALCDRFLTALETLHWQRAPALRAAMTHGYALHLDATCDRGRGGLFLCLDGFTGWVLHALRIASENEAELRPAIARTLAVFGDPLATMRDLGSGIAKALADCRQRGIPDLLCHYHFLAAVGQQLLDEDYARLRNLLSRSKLRSRLRELLRATRAPCEDLRQDLPALLLWLLEGTGHKHPAFPFALPHLDFYLRCERFSAACERRLPEPRSRRERHVLGQVASALHDLRWLQRPAPTARRLERRWALFCELRDVLRLAPQDLPHGQRPQPAAMPPERLLQVVAADLAGFQQELRQRLQALPSEPPQDPPEALLLAYLERYGEGLCGHPLVRDHSGRIVAVVARTNNVLEQFFATAKQALRRRLGRAHLGRDLEDQPPQVALVANLHDPHYVRILCGSLDQLPQAFAALDCPTKSDPSRLQRNNRDAPLRRRNRAWADDATFALSSPPALNTQTPSATGL